MKNHSFCFGCGGHLDADDGIAGVKFFAPSTLTWCLFFSIDFCARFFCVFFRIVKNGYPTQ